MQITRLSKKTAQKGVSLLELIIVIAIMGSIVLGGAAVINRTMVNFAVSNLIGNASKIQLIMLRVYKTGGKGEYPNVGTDNKKMQQLKDSLIQMGHLKADDFANPFNPSEELQIVTTSYNGNPNRAFLIRINELNEDECRLTVLNAVNVFEYVYVGTGAPEEIKDIYDPVTTFTGTGKIKSEHPKSLPFDETDLDNFEKLCGNKGVIEKSYRVYLGSH